MICTGYLVICTETLMIYWTWRAQLHEQIKQIHKSWFWCVLSPSDSHQFTLDLNTVHKFLRMSENKREIVVTNRDQSYPDHPDRFDYWRQVLCRESVCGRCYWELEWSGNNGVRISVSYKSISRKGVGNECRFGSNDQSWSLFCSPSKCTFWHNKIQTVLPVESISSRIGVFVDHKCRNSVLLQRLWHNEPHPHSPDHIHSAALSWVWIWNQIICETDKYCWWIRIDRRELLPIMLWAAW